MKRVKFNHEISLGDIVVFVTLLGAVAVAFFDLKEKTDMHEAAVIRHQFAIDKLEECCASNMMAIALMQQEKADSKGRQNFQHRQGNVPE